MKYVRTEGILPNIIDRDTPNELQYIKEWDVFEVQECNVCGKIFEEDVFECDVCDSRDFSRTEMIVEE
jgi:recombinational DNA repair protein RecR